MATKTVSVKIKGISPLLMNAFPLVKIDNFAMLSMEEQAEAVVYRTPNKELYVPGVALQRCFVGAATYSKGKGRASLQKVVAACVIVSPEYCLLHQNEYVIDTRAVVVPATKGRILRHRPRFDEWEISFDVDYDPNLLKEDQLRQVIDDAGSRVGLLDYRPEKKGPFGRFMVIEWK